MVRVFDMELNSPSGGATDEAPHALQGSGATFKGREAERVTGHGMSNYGRIFTRRSEGSPSDRRAMSIEDYATMLKNAGVEKSMLRAGTNTRTAQVQRQYPDLFVGFAVCSPYDGMPGVREFE